MSSYLQTSKLQNQNPKKLTPYTPLNISEHFLVHFLHRSWDVVFILAVTADIKPKGKYTRCMDESIIKK